MTRFDETRDNLTDTEAALMAADAHADTREDDDNRPMEHRVADSWWTTLHAKAADTRPRLWPDGSPMADTVWHTGFSLCDCEHCTTDDDDDDDDGSIAAALFSQPHFGG